MIFVDTSVWVAAFRSREGHESRALRRLLDEDEVALAIPVKIEILAGASREDRARLRTVLSALPVHYPKATTWHLIDRWLDQAASVGERFGFADLVIAAIVAEQDSALWSLDADFRRMARIGLVALFEPAHS